MEVHALEKRPEDAAIAAITRSVVGAFPVPALVIALDDTVLACNEAAARLLDVSPALVVGSAFRDLDVSFRIAQLRATIESVKGGGPARDLSTTYVRSDDQAIGLRATVGPLRHENRTCAVQVTLEDVSRLTALEGQVSTLTRQLTMTADELQVANEELEVANAELRSETAGLAARLEVLGDATRASEAAADVRLRQSEARFRALLSSSIIGVFVADAETIREFNAAFLSIIGCSADDIAGARLRWRDLTVPEYRERDDRALQTLHARGECPPYEKELVRPDGRRVPVLAGGARVSGTPFSWVCFVIDLTERRRLERCRDAEHAVARSLADARQREQAIPRILEALCRILDWEVGELWEVQAGAARVRRVAVWCEPDLANTEFGHVDAVVEMGAGEGLPGQVWALGRSLLLDDLCRVPHIARAASAAAAGLVAGLGVPIAFGGVVIGVMTFFRRRHEAPDEDLLKTLEAIGNQIGQFLVRTHGEEALALSERKARALLEQAAEGIVVIDPAGCIEMVNAKAEAMFGYTRVELVGQPLEVLLPERFRGAHRGHRSSYFAAPRTRPMGLGLELAARRKDGSEFPVEIGLSHAETDTGMVAMAFVTDVTERRALERASRHAERLTALGTLAAGVAHELNNPIGIMSSRIELMLLDGDALPAAVRDDLAVLHRNAVRAMQITQRLLAFARQPGGERRILDVNALVREALALVQSQIERDGVRLRTELADALPGVHGDPTALHQVLVNLLINAKEAMTAGDIVVRTRRGTETGWIQLAVADTGPGITPEVLARIFDPFYTTKPTGTGLGLAISYGIVRDHHGRIDVESMPGRGTTFVITFPSITDESSQG